MLSVPAAGDKADPFHRPRDGAGGGPRQSEAAAARGSVARGASGPKAGRLMDPAALPSRMDLIGHRGSLATIDTDVYRFWPETAAHDRCDDCAARLRIPEGRPHRAPGKPAQASNPGGGLRAGSSRRDRLRNRRKHRRTGRRPALDAGALCSALGFAGFSEMQKVFRSRFRDGVADYRDPSGCTQGARGRPRRNQAAGGLLRGGLLFAHPPEGAGGRQNLDRILDVLVPAETIYLVGQRRSFPVTSYLAYALSKIGVRNVLVDNVASMAPETLRFASRESDAVIAVSFTPYSSVTVDLANDLSARGVPLVAIDEFQRVRGGVGVGPVGSPRRSARARSRRG